MNTDAERVLTAALDRPDVDRPEIVEALIGSFQPSDQPPFDETWREVIERRSSESKAGMVAGIPRAEAKRRAMEVRG